MNSATRAAACILLLGTMTCFAQEIGIPHTFEAGTPALASEVNANFSTLTDAVNQNIAALQGLEGGGAQQIGVMELMDARFNGAQIPIYWFNWAGVYTLPSATPQGSWALEPISIGKLPDAYSTQLFDDLINARAFTDVRIHLNTVDSVATSYLISSAAFYLTEFGTSTVGGRPTPFERLRFSAYDQLSVTTNDPVNGERTTCYNVALNSVVC